MAPKKFSLKGRDLAPCNSEIFSSLSLKPGSHITVMVPAVVSKAEYDYGACVLFQVPQAEFSLAVPTVREK